MRRINNQGSSSLPGGFQKLGRRGEGGFFRIFIAAREMLRNIPEPEGQLNLNYRRNGSCSPAGFGRARSLTARNPRRLREAYPPPRVPNDVLCSGPERTIVCVFPAKRGVIVSEATVKRAHRAVFQAEFFARALQSARFSSSGHLQPLQGCRCCTRTCNVSLTPHATMRVPGRRLFRRSDAQLADDSDDWTRVGN